MLQVYMYSQSIDYSVAHVMCTYMSDITVSLKTFLSKSMTSLTCDILLLCILRLYYNMGIIQLQKMK